jgi:putative endonuclease
MTNRRKLGQMAEMAAERYLIEHGLRLVTRNFYSRFGEIDLIMRDQDCLVFVEVKARRLSLIEGLYSITPHKQRKLIQTAKYYILKLGYQPCCRFDAVILTNAGEITWLRNIIQE